MTLFPHRFDKALQRFGFPFGHVAFTLAMTSPPPGMSWDDMLDMITIPDGAEEPYEGNL